jgi:hypothetical protein
MRIELFKKPNENLVAVAVTFVLFVLLFVLKTQEDQSRTTGEIIKGSEIEIASASLLK